MSNKSIRMAILDDGIHPEACPLERSFLIDDAFHIIATEKSTIEPDSHGSMCARIIRKYADLDKVSVFSIQILQNDTKRGNINSILKAFELCVTLDIRLIHLSVGTYTFEDFAKLEEAVCKLLAANRLLVAAAGNRNTVTYPAFLPGVIGVKCHPRLTNGEYIHCHDPFTRIHFQASAKHRLDFEGNEVETQISNSYAAPVITSRILSYLNTDADLGYNDILRLLKENAAQNTPKNNDEPNPYPPVEIPAVVLSGFSFTRLSRLIKLLVDCLKRDDYHVRSATNLPGIRPWDEVAFQDSNGLDTLIARMAWYFSCEIILLGLQSFVPPGCSNVSLWIYGDKSDGLLSSDTLINGDVLWAMEQPDIMVYEQMMGVLKCEVDSLII